MRLAEFSFVEVCMVGQISIGKSAFVTGIVLAVFHLCWSVLVAVGLAQATVDFVFWMHFIKPVWVIEPFSVGRAAILLVVTAGIGFAIGAMFALVWNSLHKA
jgi:hypothetical protein